MPEPTTPVFQLVLTADGFVTHADGTTDADDTTTTDTQED